MKSVPLVLRQRAQPVATTIINPRFATSSHHMSPDPPDSPALDLPTVGTHGSCVRQQPTTPPTALSLRPRRTRPHNHALLHPDAQAVRPYIMDRNSADLQRLSIICLSSAVFTHWIGTRIIVKILICVKTNNFFGWYVCYITEKV